MKVTRLGRVIPLRDAASLGSGGGTISGIPIDGSGAPGSGTVPTATGSNTWAWASNVATITVNQTTTVLGPHVNVANGSNTVVTVDQVNSLPSNTIRIHATGGAASFGSNATHVAEISAGGASSDSARMDHYHAGIATVTASSSNTMQRGTFNLRNGNNVSFGLTDTDGDGEFDTLTIHGAAGGGGSLTVADEGTPLATSATTLDFVGAGVTATGTGATKTITIAGGGAPSSPYSTNLEVWLDANDITSPPSDGSDLTTWDDKSGNGHDFTNSANKPTYETNEVNGMPVVRFATNDVLEGGDLSASFPSAATLIIAYQFTTVQTSWDLFEDASEDLWWNFGNNGYMGPFRSARIEAVPNNNYPNILPTFGAHIAVVRSNSNDYQFWHDSGPKWRSAGAYQIGTVAHLGKGQNSSFVGDIMEVLLYDAFIHDAGIAESMAYLRDKWGIPT